MPAPPLELEGSRQLPSWRCRDWGHAGRMGVSITSPTADPVASRPAWLLSSYFLG